MKLHVNICLGAIIVACIITPVMSIQKVQQQLQQQACRGPDIRPGTCIPIKACPLLLNELLTQHTNKTFVRFLKASNSICGGTGTMVCCPSLNGQTEWTISRPLIKNTNEIPRRLLTPGEGCGYTSNTYKKFVGGEVNKVGAWPWIALIGYDDELLQSSFKCGGTLITARHVITAAHCVVDGLSFVRLGEHDLTNDTEARHIDIRVVRSEKHPDYNGRSGHSDIGILYLEHNVNFTEFILPICMPFAPELRQKSYVSYTPFIIGWGKTMEAGNNSDNVLQELQIPVFENKWCRNRYRQQNLTFPDNKYDESVLCAGLLESHFCQGDYGGPLMIPETYQDYILFYLVGVVAHDIGCNRSAIPGVYTNTRFFMDWILQKVADTP